MEKALAVIQFKLEEQTIRAFPEYDMDSRLCLDRLAQMLSSGSTDALNDTYFPTVDVADPGKLSREELAVIDDLANQFVSNRKSNTLKLGARRTFSRAGFSSNSVRIVSMSSSLDNCSSLIAIWSWGVMISCWVNFSCCLSSSAILYAGFSLYRFISSHRRPANWVPV